MCTLARQPNGNLLVGGQFDRLNGTVRAGIGRLLAGGTLDVGFAPATTRPVGRRPDVRQVAVQPDGRVLLLGDFNLRANASARQTLARVTAVTGQSDRTFQPADITDVRRLLVQPNGRIVAAGRALWRALGSPVVIWRMSASGTFDARFALTEMSTAPGSRDFATALTRDPGTGALLCGRILRRSGRFRHGLPGPANCQRSP